MAIAPRPASALALVVVVSLAGCGMGEEPEGPALASPSAACEEAFAEAEEAAERPAPESPRSPDIDGLKDTLEACASADEWRTAARGHDAALPLELDRETALDMLCERDADTPVCEDWRSSGSGAGTGGAPEVSPGS